MRNSRVKLIAVPSFGCAILLSLMFFPFTPAAKTNKSQQRVTAGATGKIAFASDRDGNLEIYIMDVDGGGQTRLTENPGEDYSPAWSPDGKHLAFVSTRDGDAEIYSMNADGTAQTRL